MTCIVLFGMESVVNIAIAGVTDKNSERLFRYGIEKYPGGTFFIYKNINEVFERMGEIEYQRLILSDSYSENDVNCVKDYVNEKEFAIEVELYI